jgi:glycosyltransferase involved in cell wall biosynthesis
VKILHVFKDYFPPTHGGIEQHIHEIVHSVDGFEFAVLTSSRSKEMVIDSDNGVRVIRTPEYARPASTPVTPAWVRLLGAAGADLLHFHMPNPFGEIAYLASRTWVPMVVSYHADIVGRQAAIPLFSPLQNRFLREAERIVVSSPRILETSKTLAPHRDRAVVIPFGVDPNYWGSRPAQTDRLRERHGSRVVLFLGRLAHYKGLDVLIEAMGRVSAKLLIVGDGPRRPALEAAVQSNLPRHKVEFVGEITVEERAAYYHAADVFVLPSTSRAEAFGIAMLEAMACGTPAISTEVGTGTSWVNVSGETGVVVPPGDPGALSGAIKALFGDDRLRKRLGEAAALRVSEHFTKERMLQSLASLYSEVRGRPKPAEALTPA